MYYSYRLPNIHYEVREPASKVLEKQFEVEKETTDKLFQQQQYSKTQQQLFIVLTCCLF